MKVLLYDTTLSFITPGGKTTHAIKLQQEIKKLGIDIEFGQWWNKNQGDYDLIHTLAHQVNQLVDFTHKKGKKIVLTHIMDLQANKPAWKQRLEIFRDSIQSIFPFTMEKIDGNSAIPKFDHVVYMNNADRNTALKYYTKLVPSNTSIITHAFDPKDMGIGKDVQLDIVLPEKYLISTANIDWRKQSHLLAKYAKDAEVPIVFIGGANKADNYYANFMEEVDNKHVYYLGYVDVATKDYLLTNAAGFALLSLAESGCIAVYEAAAYNLPLFLSNLPWAKGYEAATNISFCDFKNPTKAKSQLQFFFSNKAGRKDMPPFKTRSWEEIAKQYVEVYKSVLNS